jgi:shikimate kinase
MKRQHIYLVGPGNVGKTTVGPHLATQLNRPFTDLDQEFMTRVGHIGQLIDTAGYTKYRQQNAALLRQLVKDATEPTVFALSSGFLISRDYDQVAADLDFLKQTGVTCLLLPSPDAAGDAALIADRAASRPYLKTDREREMARYRLRFAEYQTISADLTIYSKDAPEAIAQQIATQLGLSSPPANIIYYALPGLKNPIHNKSVVNIGKTMRRDLDMLAERIQRERPALVIGLGRTNTTSGYEYAAQNLFHGREIIKYAPTEYPLFIPNTDWPTNSGLTSSFCNWSAFRLAHLIATNELPTKLAFLHLTKTEAATFGFCSLGV